MRVFGMELFRAKASSPASLSPVPTANRGNWGWWPFGVVNEPFTGAFQRDIAWTADTVLAHHAVYACITLISNDVGKLRPKLVELDADGIWTETRSSAFSPVLRKPNRYQNYIQFKEWWTTSKLLRGNTYALKQRDERKVVEKLYLLDPQRVTVMVAPDGSVFYSLQSDNMAGKMDVKNIVPASEIIHDRMNCLFHPLVGISPLFACGLAANMGLKILENSSHFFNNGSNPGGVLSAPATIPQATADRIKEHWDKNYGGENAGKVAVLGDGLKFEPMRMTNEDSQLIEQLKFTAEMVASAFHVPPFKIGIGAAPSHNNTEILNSIYYSDCLQSHIEQFELCMDEGLGIGEDNPKDGGKIYGVELETDSLLRMDMVSQMAALKEGIGAGIMKPNEARSRINLKPVPGGDTPYLQQQNYGLEALARRDAIAPAPSTAALPPETTPPGDKKPPKKDDDPDIHSMMSEIRTMLAQHQIPAMKELKAEAPLVPPGRVYLTLMLGIEQARTLPHPRLNRN